MSPATAVATRPAAGTTKAPRINEKRKFVDEAKGRLSVVLRKFKTGFLTYEEWKEAGAETRKRGLYKQHDTEAAARAEFERLIATVERDGWIEKLAVPRSEFDQSPRPAAAPAQAARPARAAAGGRRR